MKIRMTRFHFGNGARDVIHFLPYISFENYSKSRKYIDLGFLKLRMTVELFV